MRHQRRFLQWVVACLVAICLSSCQSREDLQAIIGTTADNDKVPLLRPMPLVAMSEPMVIEFDLPPPGSNSSTALAVGLWVGESDGLRSYEAARKVVNEGVEAVIRLQRLGEGAPSEVTLLRSQPVPLQSSQTVELVDAIVPSATYSDVDTVSMRKVGLKGVDDDSKELELAWVRNSIPGRYRLSVQITQAAPELEQIRSQLLVAYLRKQK